MGYLSMKPSTSSGIKKTAALPEWLHASTKKIDPRKSAPGVSKKGLLHMLKHRGVK